MKHSEFAKIAVADGFVSVAIAVNEHSPLSLELWERQEKADIEADILVSPTMYWAETCEGATVIKEEAFLWTGPLRLDACKLAMSLLVRDIGG